MSPIEENEERVLKFASTPAAITAFRSFQEWLRVSPDEREAMRSTLSDEPILAVLPLPEPKDSTK